MIMGADYPAYEPPRNYVPFLFVPVIGAIAIAAGTGLGGGEAPDIASVVVLVLLTVLGIAFFSLASRADPESAILFQVLMLAWLARLVAMGVKLYIFYGVAGGVADAAAYHRVGESIAQAFLASGELPDLTHFWSSTFVELVTGFLYVVTGPTLIGGWIVFNFLAMLGMLLHYKAFVTAFPDGNRRLFMALIFFAPTLLMWTNTVGKDALMAFFLGVAAYGMATLYRGGLRVSPLVYTLVGLAGVTVVRPHLGAVVVTAVAGAIFLQPIRAGFFGTFARVLMIAAIVPLAVVVVRTAASFINLEDLSVEGVIEFAQEEGGEESGSLAFQGGGFPTSPQGAAQAFLTVLFRPFPWESGNLLIRASGLEGVALIGLLIYRIRSVWRAILNVRRNSYIAFVAIFAVLFITIFSTIANFGILIRQRAQLLPFIFVFVAFQQVVSRVATEPDVP